MDLQNGDASSSSDDDIDLGTDGRSLAASRQSLASVYSSFDKLIEAWSSNGESTVRCSLRRRNH